MPRPVIIANPHAGQKAGFKTNLVGPDDLRQILERHGVDADLWLTDGKGHATDLARRAAQEGRPLAIAAGGDGTVTEVAAGLLGSEMKLGLLPLGSIMNLARMLGVPRDLDAAAEAVKHDHCVRIDVGRATSSAGERIFLEAAGVGVSAALFTYANQIDSGNWRTLRPLWRFLVRFRPRRMQVTVDGQSRGVQAIMVTVANGPLLGAAFEVAPDARLDDRQLTIKIFSASGKHQLFTHLLAVLRRKTYSSGIFTLHGRRVEIEGRHPLMVHADSHALGTTPAHFELLPSALSVVVPEHPDPACEPALVGAPASATVS